MKNLLHYITRFFLSLKLTVVCLAILFVLVLWGTLYQVENGLYLAHQRFFDSWLIWGFGFIPLPGTQLVLALLFVNLFYNMVFQFTFGWRKLGIVLIHLGLMFLLAGGWVTQRFGSESFLTLDEGETSNLASSYRDWEVAAWRDGPGTAREVTAVDAKAFQKGRVLPFDKFGLNLVVETYHPNSRAFRSTQTEAAEHIFNASGITLLEGAPRAKDPQEEVPGVLFTIQGDDTPSGKLLLFGGEAESTRVRSGEETIVFSLRRKRIPLPMAVSLVKFNKEFHPNSQIPKSFSSLISVNLQGVERDVLVEMNRPFRYQGYTFYQASYADMGQGRQQSTFAVAFNVGRLIPYVATAITVLGLALHFIVELYRRRGGSRR